MGFSFLGWFRNNTVNAYSGACYSNVYPTARATSTWTVTTSNVTPRAHYFCSRSGKRWKR